jgi:hypothetical protein
MPTKRNFYDEHGFAKKPHNDQAHRTQITFAIQPTISISSGAAAC